MKSNERTFSIYKQFFCCFYIIPLLFLLPSNSWSQYSQGWSSTYTLGTNQISAELNSINGCNQTWIYCLSGNGNAISHSGLGLIGACANPSGSITNISTTASCGIQSPYSGPGDCEDAFGNTYLATYKADCGGNQCWTVNVVAYGTSSNGVGIVIKAGSTCEALTLPGPDLCADECANLTSRACNDYDPCTIDDVEYVNCAGTVCVECEGSPVASCTLTAYRSCNDGSACTEDDKELYDTCTDQPCGPCQGTPIPDCTLTDYRPCDDYNDCTEDDKELYDTCTNQPCGPCEGTAVPSCTGSNVVWRWCDDGDPCTENDMEDYDTCTGEICLPCQGTPVAACALTAYRPCNDYNDCTEDDQELYDTCTGLACGPCEGTAVPSCTGSNVVWRWCDDGDPCTENDMEDYDTCTGEICWPCQGTPIAACAQTAYRPCNDYNDCTEEDKELYDTCTNQPCGPCEGTAVPSCTGSNVVWRWCDDGDPCTENDMEDYDTCTGEICWPCQGTDIPGCGEEYCTYTIGYWGNHPDDLAEALSYYGGSLHITINGTSYTLTASCLDFILPGPPHHKRHKTHCGITYDMNNNNLRQSIGMLLNIGFNNGIDGDLSLSDILCQSASLSHVINNNLATDIDGLIDCALGGNTVCGQALASISELFDECAQNAPCEDLTEAPPIGDIENENNYNLQVIQNPTSGTINFTLDEKASTPIQVLLFDTNGNLVFTTQFVQEEHQSNYDIIVDDLKSGAYILRVSGKKVHTKKVLIHK